MQSSQRSFVVSLSNYGRSGTSPSTSSGRTDIEKAIHGVGRTVDNIAKETVISG
jgi:hypothetical protein